MQPQKNLSIPTVGIEPLKITFSPKEYGYTGTELKDELQNRDITCEFADPDFTVLMLTPEIGQDGLDIIKNATDNIRRKDPIGIVPPKVHTPARALTPREAVFMPQEKLPVADCCGRILANTSIGCPPAVPIAVCGEIIDENIINTFKYYGIDKCFVVKEN